MQGALFHDERTNPIPTSFEPGQSQSKTAKYFREYRKNPEKNRKINENRRRNRKVNRDSSNVSSMFESAAPATTLEQQTIEKTLSRSDNLSLPNPGDETSDQLTGSSPGYFRRIYYSVPKRNSIDTSDETPINIDMQNQADLLLELRDSFRGIHNELKMLREEVKPATPVNVEPQTGARDIATPNGSKVSDEASTEQVDKHNFIKGFFRQLSQIDGAAFVRNFPAALVLGFCAYYACLFVAEQTVPLYESLQFPNPEMSCFGAIGIAVGFSALSAISRMEIIKLFTAVIIIYEVLIVWSGSQANQKQLSYQALRANPTHFSISETYGIAKTDYEQKKARYEDKNSEVYHNGWFKINHLDPAKLKMDEASAKLVTVESELGERYQTDWIHFVLKALYRLSAIALVMLLAKETIKRGVGALSFRNFKCEPSWK